MRVVFVNRFYAPDLSATSQMLTDLAVHVAEMGHEVHVVCSSQLYEDPNAPLKPEERIDGVVVHRVRGTRFGRRNLWGRAVDYLSFYFGAFRKLKQVVTPGTILVAKTDPPLISVVAAKVTRSKDAVLINWLQDMFPEVVLSLRPTLVRSFLGKSIYRLAERGRNRSLHIAKKNVVLGQQMAAQVEGKIGKQHGITVIPNWSDADRVVPIDHADNHLRKEWGLEDRFVVMYSGNMGLAHDFDTLLNAAVALSSRKNIAFLFVGGGARKDYVEQMAARLGLNNFFFKPYQPSELLAQSLGIGSVHYISLLPSLEGFIVPSKFYGVLAAGRPSIFVGAPDGELGTIIANERVGLVFNQGNSQDLAAGIELLADNASLRSEMGKTARNLFEGSYSRQSAFAKWKSILSECHAHHGGGQRISQ